MDVLLSDELITKLGTIETWAESNLDNSIVIYENNQSTTISHKIILQSFELPNKFPCNSYTLSKRVKSIICWRWFIERVSDMEEQLNIFCKLVNPQTDVTSDVDPGECLEAVEIENKIYHLHIGTEDGEILQHRASKNDFMPQRFQNILGWHKDENYYSEYTFTKYIDFGFKIDVPNLLKGEKIYFHFIVATDDIRINQDDSKYINVSTWLAVDRSKKYLDGYFENITKSDRADRQEI